MAGILAAFLALALPKQFVSDMRRVMRTRTSTWPLRLRAIVRVCVFDSPVMADNNQHICLCGVAPWAECNAAGTAAVSLWNEEFDTAGGSVRVGDARAATVVARWLEVLDAK